jgi:hypothetical protein
MQLVKIHAQKYAKYELNSAKKKAQQHQELIASSCPTQLLARGSEQYPRRYLLWNPFIYCNP